MPMYEMTIRSLGVRPFNSNSPLMFVLTPFFVPLIITEAPITTSSLSYRTTPLTLNVWAMASATHAATRRSKNNLFLIIKYCPRDNPGSVLRHTGMRPRFVFCFVVRLTVQNEGVPWLHTLA